MSYIDAAEWIASAEERLIRCSPAGRHALGLPESGTWTEQEAEAGRRAQDAARKRRYRLKMSDERAKVDV